MQTRTPLMPPKIIHRLCLLHHAAAPPATLESAAISTRRMIQKPHSTSPSRSGKPDNFGIAAGFGCGWMPKTKVKHNVMRAPAACRSSAANLPFPSCQASFSAPSHASYLERYRITSEPGSTFFVVNDSVLKSNPWRANRSVNPIKPEKIPNN